MIIEACCENAKEGLAAERNGATRIELCSHLEVEGLTPKYSDMETLMNSNSIPVRPMLRPRNSFSIDPSEYHEIFKQAHWLLQYPIEGVVLGYLKNKKIDEEFLEAFFCEFPKCKVTFHKAIDICENLEEAVEQCNKFSGIDYILSSGGKATALEGISNLQKMQKVAQSRVMAAGSITWKNLPLLKERLSLEAFHGRRIVGDLDRKSDQSNR